MYYAIPKPEIEKKTGLATLWLELDIYDEEAGKRLGFTGTDARVAGLFVASADMQFVMEKEHKSLVCLTRLNASFYTKTDRHNYKWFIARKTVSKVLKQLYESGYITFEKGDRIRAFTSRWQITEKFREFLRAGPLHYNNRRHTNRIILKDINKLEIPYKYNKKIYIYKKHLQTINNILAQSSYTYITSQPIHTIQHYINTRTQLPIGEEGYVSVTNGTNRNEIKDIRHVENRRIFNENFNRGGRFYSSIQLLTKAERMTLEIDGEKTVELDFVSYHPNILYNLKGYAARDDLYNIDNINREVIKELLLTSISASSRRSTIAAYQEKMNNDQVPGLIISDIHRALDAIDRRHSAIVDKLYTGIGIKLQYLDSLVAQDVMLTCAKDNISVICIHDSFIVKERHCQFLKTAMISSYKKILKTRFNPLIK